MTDRDPQRGLRVLQLLEERGPMTLEGIAEHFGTTKVGARSTLRRLRNNELVAMRMHDGRGWWRSTRNTEHEMKQLKLGAFAEHRNAADGTRE